VSYFQGLKRCEGGHWHCFKQTDTSSMVKNKAVMFTPLSYPNMAKARIL